MLPFITAFAAAGPPLTEQQKQAAIRAKAALKDGTMSDTVLRDLRGAQEKSPDHPALASLLGAALLGQAEARSDAGGQGGDRSWQQISKNPGAEAAAKNCELKRCIQGNAVWLDIEKGLPYGHAAGKAVYILRQIGCLLPA